MINNATFIPGLLVALLRSVLSSTAAFATEARDTGCNEYQCPIIRDSVKFRGVKEEMVTGTRFSSRVSKLGRVDHGHVHKLIFAVKPRNLDVLSSILDDVSNPSSPAYGKFKSRDEVAELTTNPISRDTLVTYLSESLGNEVKIVSESLYGEYITAVAPTAIWEHALGTEFHKFRYKHGSRVRSNEDEFLSRNSPLWEPLDSTQEKEEEVVRCEHYTLPAELMNHVEYVFNTVQMPVLSPIHRELNISNPLELNSLYAYNSEVLRRNLDNTASSESSSDLHNVAMKDIPNTSTDTNTSINIDSSIESDLVPPAEDTIESGFHSDARVLAALKNPVPGYINPQFLRAVYSITDKGSNGATQAVFESLNQTFSPADLTLFESTFKLPLQKIAGDIGGHCSSSWCKTHPESCG